MMKNFTKYGDWDGVAELQKYFITYQTSLTEYSLKSSLIPVLITK